MVFVMIWCYGCFIDWCVIDGWMTLLCDHGTVLQSDVWRFFVFVFMAFVFFGGRQSSGGERG